MAERTRTQGALLYITALFVPTVLGYYTWAWFQGDIKLHYFSGIDQSISITARDDEYMVRIDDREFKLPKDSSKNLRVLSVGVINSDHRSLKAGETFFFYTDQGAIPQKAVVSLTAQSSDQHHLIETRLISHKSV